MLVSQDTVEDYSPGRYLSPSIALRLIVLLYMRRAHQRFHRPNHNAEARAGLVRCGHLRGGLYHHSRCLAAR